MDRLLIKQLQSKAQNLAVAEVRPEVSVVVPIYNEVESLPHLIEAIAVRSRILKLYCNRNISKCFSITNTCWRDGDNL